MSNLHILTKLFVENALADKPCSGLLYAYNEECAQVAEENGENLDKMLDAPESADECDKVMAAAFVVSYRLTLDHPCTEDEALEVFVYPANMPECGVPRRLLDRVGHLMGRQAARDGNAMRRAMAAKMGVALD